MADDELLDLDHRGEQGFRPSRYRPAQWEKALKLLGRENSKWRKVGVDDLIEIVGVDDARRHRVLKDIALELRHDKDDLAGLEDQIRSALAEARIRPDHWFG